MKPTKLAATAGVFLSLAAVATLGWVMLGQEQTSAPPPPDRNTQS